MDNVDLATDRHAIELERAIAARKAASCVFSESATHCHGCGAEIAPSRRQAVPGVVLCIGCAEVAENVGRHRHG